MKIKNIDGYAILHTENGLPMYCIKRTPTFVPIPARNSISGANNMEIATMQGPIHYCGSHCPFFTNQGTLLELRCNISHEPSISSIEFIEEPEKPNLKLH